MWTRYLWVTLVGVGLASATVFGAESGGRHHKASSAPSPQNPAEMPPPPVPTQLSQDQAAEVAAATELANDNKALKTLSDALLAKFQQTPDWTAAQNKLADVQSALEAAKKAASDSLSSNPDYQSALADKQKAVDDLNAAKASGDATPETLSPLATASMLASMKLKKVQNEVLKLDPGVQAASIELTAVQHNVDLLKMKFQQGMSADKEYAAAKATVDAAQQKYDGARAKVASDEGQ
ncbi:MAG: hypothetical protein ABSB74_10415 [Tepidisphaeraceae bacterium]